jgi:hypothetical protein
VPPVAPNGANAVSLIVNTLLVNTTGAVKPSALICNWKKRSSFVGIFELDVNAIIVEFALVLNDPVLPETKSEEITLPTVV